MAGDFVNSKSRDAGSLDQRIAENKGSESTDFTRWLFDKIHVGNQYRILELCCGTGAQTLEFLKDIGDQGHITAMDISQEAISRLESKIPTDWKKRITLISSDIDQFEAALRKKKLSGHFDLIFCSYGLYYSKKPKKVLSIAKKWLKSDGSIIVVGPFGPNNKSLFSFLRSCGVRIPDFVKYSSQDFMGMEVIPWATLNFHKIQIFTMLNDIRWQSPQNLLSYWKNSTFFDQFYEPVVEKTITEHFNKNPVFINQKWVMMVVMENG